MLVHHKDTSNYKPIDLQMLVSLQADHPYGLCCFLAGHRSQSISEELPRVCVHFSTNYEYRACIQAPPAPHPPLGSAEG